MVAVAMLQTAAMESRSLADAKPELVAHAIQQILCAYMVYFSDHRNYSGDRQMGRIRQPIGQRPSHAKPAITSPAAVRAQGLARVGSRFCM